MSVVRAAKLAADQVRTCLAMPKSPVPAPTGGACGSSATLLLEWFGDEWASIQSKPQDRSCII